MRRGLGAIAALIAWCFPGFSAQDLHLLIGLALVTVGCAYIAVPLAWIVPGAVLLYLAWPKPPTALPPPARRREPERE